MASNRMNNRFIRRPNTGSDRPVLQSLEPRKLLSATAAQIAQALDLPDGVVVTLTGHDDGIGVYENYTVEGLLGLPTGPDGDFLAISTAHAFDAVRTTDAQTRDHTTHYRDLGVDGAADDFVTLTFSITVPPGGLAGQRLLFDFVYASDLISQGGDFFDIIVNGTNLGESDARGRVESGGAYVTNERDPGLDVDVPGYGFVVGTEYSDLLTAAYTIADGETTLDITIMIADSGDANIDAWALLDNVRIEQPQTIYLDFDGQDIGGFYLDGTHYIVPVFDANDFGLGSDFADVIRADMESLFADFNVVFVTNEPTDGPYMHVVVGGRNSDLLTVDDTENMQWLIRDLSIDQNALEVSFERLYNYVQFRDPDAMNHSYGLADRLDLGNARRDDMAVIFSDEISRRGYGYTNLRDAMAHYIGRNLGLRPEADTATGSIMNVDIDRRGSAFEDTGNRFLSDEWGDFNFVDQPGIRQNDHAILTDVLGSSAGAAGIGRSWRDAAALNQAHWTATPPTNRPLFDAAFVVIGDPHTRTVTTWADQWPETQILITDYAGQDPQIVITAATRDGGPSDYETRGPRNLGQFSDVTRDASISLISLFSNGLQSFTFRGSASLIQTIAIGTEVFYSTFDYTDLDGDLVTLRLNSNTGLFTVDGTDESMVITLAETVASRDTFTITVKKRGDGDGRVTLSGLNGTGLRSITAKRTDFNGVGFDLFSLRTARIGSIFGGTDFNVRQDDGVRGDYVFETIDGDSRFTFGRETRRFRAMEVTGGTYSFDDTVKIDIRGDFNADRVDIEDGDRAVLIVRGDITTGVWTAWTESEKRESWKTISLRGDVSGVTLSTVGRVKRLKVIGSFDADVTVLAFLKATITGDWTGSMQLTHNGDHFKQAAKTIRANGIVHDLLFQSGDSVNVFSLGRIENARLYVGFDFSVTDGLVTDPALITNEEARVNKFRLRGIRDIPFDMEASIVSSVEFGTLTLRDINGDNSGVPFGVSARSIDSITYDTGTGRVHNRREDSFIDNDSGDDFLLGRIL